MALGLSTMAFELTYANIINRANLGDRSMYSPNAHHFPLRKRDE
ncbi:photosystem II protein D1 (PsbA) [Geitlerinema sp. FC II]|nr:photosystem II protein D1 (PsbA) [Geitlerinema sp. FC II]